MKTDDDERMADYERWIAAYQPIEPYGKCAETTKAMAAAFPELRRERGHYVCPVQGRLTHWWLVTPDGQVVDPTRDQFASKGRGRYERHVGPEPTGTCINCGGLLYGKTTSVCNDECYEEMRAYLEAEIAEDGRRSRG